MKLTKQKTDSIEPHLKRIFPDSEVIVVSKSITDMDISSLVIKTARGTLSIGTSTYSGEFTVSVTVPEKEYAITFKAFDSEITKGFKTEKERDDFVEKLPDEQKATAIKSEREI